MLAAAVAGALSMSSAAFATLSFPVATSGPGQTVTGFSLVNVPITTGALADDPNLANYDTYDLQVNVNPTVGGAQDFWAGGDMRFSLSKGKFYSPPDPDASGLDVDTGAPATANIVGLRDTGFDTYVSRPNRNSNVAIVGGSGDLIFPGSRPVATMPHSDNASNLMDISWGDTGTTNNANAGSNTANPKTVARITISKDAVGVLHGRMTSTGDPSANYFFDAVVGPEPTSLGLMGIGLGVVALRRRTK